MESYHYILLENESRRGKNVSWPEEKYFKSIKNLKAEIADAAARGVQRLVILGTPPPGFAILTDCLKYAKKKEIQRREIETIGLFEALPAYVNMLRDAGLTRALITIGAKNDPGVKNMFPKMNDPGTLFAGAANLVGSGVETAFMLYVNSDTIRHMQSTIKTIRGEFGGACEIILMTKELEGDQPQHVEQHFELDRILRRIIEDENIPIRIDARHAPPPCLMPASYRLLDLPAEAPMLSGAPREAARRKLCNDCVFRHICPGVSNKFPEELPETIRPFRELDAEFRETFFKKLKNTLPLMERYKTIIDGEQKEQIIIRTNFHCNERCVFCWVHTDAAIMPGAIIEGAIREALGTKSSKRIVSFSGGEPTLSPDLGEYIKMAADAGAESIELQTNAVKLSDAGLAKKLVQGGLTRAFVSLHGHNAEVSDRLTRTPGGFARTVEGIRNLRALGVLVQLNYVMCAENYFLIMNHLEFAAENFPECHVALSMIVPSLASDLYREIVPKLSELAPFVIEGKKFYGKKLHTLSGTSGIPICIVADGIEHFADELEPVVPDESVSAFYCKKPVCADCAANDYCRGFWRRYIEIHGDGEMKPLRDFPSARVKP